MPSSLSWIDHDAVARERSLRILALSKEKESRDELGLGGIRDSFADQLFPGTSTIQTRVRYMLFVPWIYTKVEEEQLSAKKFADKADKAERALIRVMRSADEREDGIFGGRSGTGIKRLPSAVYWAGLHLWGIRVADISQEQYHRGIEQIRARRLRDKDRSEGDYESSTDTWRPRLPPRPADLDERADFQLSRAEAEFLRDRIVHSHPNSLLADLARLDQPADVEAPWEHPSLASFRPSHQELLHHGRLFSQAMRGAALVYNLALAEKRVWEERTEEHRQSLEQWLAETADSDLDHWSLDSLWMLTADHGHTITASTRWFVQEWIAKVLSLRHRLVDDPSVREMVRRRETALKKSRSRFLNQKGLAQWGGSSGLAPLVYRWPTASTFLSDLHDGLARGRS